MKPVPFHNLSKTERELVLTAQHQTGVAWRSLTEKRNHKHLVRARWQAFKVFRDAGYSLPEIGRVFGKDHTTVLHGLKRLEQAQ